MAWFIFISGLVLEQTVLIVEYVFVNLLKPNKAEIPVGAWNRRHEKHVKSHKQAHEPASSSNILRKLLLLRFTVKRHQSEKATNATATKSEIKHLALR